MESPQLDDRTVDKNLVAKIIDRAGRGQIRILQHFFFVEAHLFSGLKQHQNMARRSRRNQFVGDLRAERPQEIEVPNEKGQVGVIGDGVKRVYLQGEMAPIFKKLAHHRQRQLAFAQLGHKCAFVNLLVRVFVKRRIEMIDVSFGFLFAQLFTRPGFP